MTMLEGNLAFNTSKKVSIKYRFTSRSDQLKYSYIHGRGGITFEFVYDFVSDSWNFSMQKEYIKVSLENLYKELKNTLGVEWARELKVTGSFKVIFSSNFFGFIFKLHIHLRK